jgi:hypothetical protein
MKNKLLDRMQKALTHIQTHLLFEIAKPKRK